MRKSEITVSFLNTLVPVLKLSFNTLTIIFNTVADGVACGFYLFSGFFFRSIYLLNIFLEDKQLLIEEDPPSRSLAGQPLRTGLD